MQAAADLMLARQARKLAAQANEAATGHEQDAPEQQEQQDETTEHPNVDSIKDVAPPSKILKTPTVMTATTHFRKGTSHQESPAVSPVQVLIEDSD